MGFAFANTLNIWIQMNTSLYSQFCKSMVFAVVGVAKVMFLLVPVGAPPAAAAAAASRLSAGPAGAPPGDGRRYNI